MASHDTHAGICWPKEPATVNTEQGNDQHAPLAGDQHMDHLNAGTYPSVCMNLSILYEEMRALLSDEHTCCLKLAYECRSGCGLFYAVSSIQSSTLPPLSGSTPTPQAHHNVHWTQRSESACAEHEMRRKDFDSSLKAQCDARQGAVAKVL